MSVWKKTTMIGKIKNYLTRFGYREWKLVEHWVTPYSETLIYECDLTGQRRVEYHS